MLRKHDVKATLKPTVTLSTLCAGDKQCGGTETNFSWNLSWPHSYWHKIAEGHRSTKATRTTTLHTYQTYKTCTFHHKEEVVILSEKIIPSERQGLKSHLAHSPLQAAGPWGS